VTAVEVEAELAESLEIVDLDPLDAGFHENL